LNYQPDNESCFWPEDLLPNDFPNCRVLTYGYDSHISHFFSGAANQTNIVAHARSFLNDLEEQRQDASRRPIIFVAHSLGGLLLKEALRQADSLRATGQTAGRDIVEIIIGTIFMGTPHRGSNYADLGLLIRGFAKAAQFDTSDALLKDLKVDATLLEILNDSFGNIYRRRKFELTTIEEGRALAIPLVGRDKVVHAVSAHLGYENERSEVINADHRSMCRFSGLDDPGYRKSKQAIRRAIRRLSDGMSSTSG
jgi:hypothetical protein